jgi:serine/threonine protein kinase
MFPQVTHWQGQTVGDGRFHISRWLRDGGMAQIFLGEDVTSRELVIIKVPKGEHMQLDASWQQRFFRECQALKRLVHPNVVRILFAGIENGLPFLLLRFLEGGTLADRMRSGPGNRQEPQPMEALVTWLPRVAHALDFLHTQGAVHRDVKPQNILFDGAGNPYLSDFGLLRDLSVTTGSSSLTRLGDRPPGTPPYMAPEQITQPQLVGPATDQFALGVVVYEWLSGGRPYAGESLEEIACSQLQPPVPLQRLLAGMPVEIAQAVGQSLALDPQGRFPTCQAFVSQLRAALESRSLLSHTASAPPSAFGPSALHSVAGSEDWSLPMSGCPGEPTASSGQSCPQPAFLSHGGSVPAPCPENGPTILAAPPAGKKFSARQLLLQALLVLVGLALAGLAGSFFLPGTAIQEWAGQPIASWLTSVDAPGWKPVRDTNPRPEQERMTADFENRIRELLADSTALRRSLEDNQAKLKAADETSYAVLKEKIELATRLAKSEEGLREESARIAIAGKETEKVQSRLNTAERVAMQSKLWFLVKNSMDRRFDFEMNVQLWSGELSGWTPHTVESGKTEPFVTQRGAVWISVRYSTSLSDSSTPVIQMINPLISWHEVDDNVIVPFLPLYIAGVEPGTKQIGLHKRLRK